MLVDVDDFQRIYNKLVTMVQSLCWCWSELSSVTLPSLKTHYSGGPRWSKTIWGW